MNVETAKARLVAHTEAQGTDRLVTAMLLIDGKCEGDFLKGLTREEILVLHTIEDVLLARHPEADTKIDQWMTDCDTDPATAEFVRGTSYASLVALAVDMASN